jgi:hypothetical protein
MIFKILVEHLFIKRILFPNAGKDIWSSTETTLPEGTIKKDFDKDSVLERFNYQLKKFWNKYRSYNEP